MMCILLKSVGNYRNYESNSDFFTFIFRTRISLLIYIINILVQKKLTKYQCFVFTPHYISKYSTQLDLFYIPKLLIK